MIMTLYVDRNLRRQKSCFCCRRRRRRRRRRHRPTAIKIESHNTTPKLYRDQPVCSTTRQWRMGPDGLWRSSKKKQTWLRRFDSRATCQQKTTRPSLPVAASLVADRLAVAAADRLAVAAAATSLVVAADTSTVFPFGWVWYLPVGFILMTLFYLILSWV